jgi:hypothetical protein
MPNSSFNKHEMVLTRAHFDELTSEADQYKVMLHFIFTCCLDPLEKQMALKQCHDLMARLPRVIKFIETHH